MTLANPCVRRQWLLICGVVFFALQVTGLHAQDKRLANALAIPTLQEGVDCDTPPKSEWKDCRLVSAKERVGTAGWAVLDETDRILRLYLDNNGDGKLDQWSFFKDGMEVYREIDTDNDKSRNEYRWFGSGGTRWGIDEDQDKTIDRWKMISAEEVANEIFEAIKTNDVQRYQRVLVTRSEIEKLGLGDPMKKKVDERLEKASDFRKLCSTQKEINSRSVYSGFGTSSPSLIPAETKGLDQDIVVYDHASAMFQTGEKYGQVAVGTIVQVGKNRWAAMELPQLATEGMAVANGGIFYPSPSIASSTQVASNPEVEAFTKLFGDLDTIEKELQKATKGSDIAKLEKRRADVMTSIIESTKDKEDRQNWVRSMTDQVADAYQRDRFPEGLSYLANYLKSSDRPSGIDVDYITWRIINSRWSKGLELDREGREEANEKYYSDLESFVKKYPESEFTSQGIMHLANNAEITQEVDDAVKWYKKLVKDYGDEVVGKRAKGALVRLDSSKSRIRFQGSTLDNRRFDSARMQGKVVVIHYWDTSCDLCIDGFDELKRLNAKYKNDLVLVGANLDSESSTVKDFLKKNRSVNWPQLWAPGGIDESPLGLQLGISVMPSLILIDQQGRLVESNLPVSDLDREIQRLQKRNARKDD